MLQRCPSFLIPKLGNYAMAALNAATVVVSDAETLQLIEEFESDFYGADEQSSDRSFRRHIKKFVYKSDHGTWEC